MKYRSTSKWRKFDGQEGLLFFAQRADELLFDYTLDTYKPAALNSSFLCQEALALIGDIEKELIDKKNLTPVLEELLWSIKGDPVAKSLLDLPRHTYVLDHNSEPLQSVRRKLDALARTLESHRYLDRCTELLGEAVSEVAKGQIDLLARLFFTSLINIGVHKAHLYSKTIDFFFRGTSPKTIDSLECFQEYAKLIFPYGHDYDVFFVASSLIRDVSESIGVFRIEFHESVPDELSEFAKSKNFEAKAGERIVEVQKVQALDCHTAREKAEHRMGRLRDLFTLYHHKNQITWNENTIIRQCCIDDLRVVALPKSPVEKGYDLKPIRASMLLNTMLKTVRFDTQDFQKFNRAVDFHGLSVTSNDPENQLLNLWIALETITPTHTGSAKISQIIDGVIPFLTINYIWRIVGRLSQDLSRWNSSEIHRILKSVPSPKNFGVIKRVFLLLVLDECEGEREDLYAALKDFHLLRFRVFSLARALNTPEKVLSLIDEHESKVSWQIRRIYRTRNLIVHSGRTPSFVSALIENAHDYLDQVLLTIVKMSESGYRVRRLEQGFELAKIGRRKMQNVAKNNEKFLPEHVGTFVNEHEFITKRKKSSK